MTTYTFNNRKLRARLTFLNALVAFAIYSMPYLVMPTASAQASTAKPTLTFSVSNSVDGRPAKDDAPITWKVTLPSNSCDGTNASFKSTWQISEDGSSWTTIAQASDSTQSLYLGSAPGYYMKVTVSELCNLTNSHGVSGALIRNATLTSPYQKISRKSN